MESSPVNNVERIFTWGTVRYNTLSHTFSYSETEPHLSDPYVNEPVVLNVVITRQCNMDCRYCVAKDFDGIENKDLLISKEMIDWINRSSFMLLVLTGGEPLMPPYDEISLRLIDSVRDRGLILDTNGTISPDIKIISKLKSNKVMLRVSMDSIRRKEETTMRRSLKGQDLNDESAFEKKKENIQHFLSLGVNTTVQTVIYQKNMESLIKMIEWMSMIGIKKWYLQRIIPSYQYKHPSERFGLRPEDYYWFVKDIASEARRAGIECIPKMDLRHNSVFLLMADGIVYTQGDDPGQKIRLGTIRDTINYFDYVSASDHACRYYLVDRPNDENI